MRHLFLIRTLPHADGTFGHLLHDGPGTSFDCCTLEPEAARVGNKGRIPAGNYAVAWEPFGKFKGYAVKQVPGFDDVEIHLGNWEEDTHGCIVIGMRRGRLLNKQNVLKEAVLDSAMAVDRFSQYMQHADFHLTIVEHLIPGGEYAG